MYPLPLVPAPQSCVPLDGALPVGNIRNILLPDGVDPRVLRTAAALRQHAFPDAVLSAASVGDPPCLSITVGGSDTEGYRLSILPDGIGLVGESPAGTFYGLQTLRQLVDTCDGLLPCAIIDDRPDFPLRGFYQDISRGRIPTLDTLKALADRLAAGKYNMLQLYVEHTFAFPEYRDIHGRTGCLTPADILELDTYCHERFIELVPSLSTFGHLYELLQMERYRPLCELEDYRPEQHLWVERMRHHTIDPTNPESRRLVKRLIDQFLPLFRSRRFNLCCDETFDLGQGRNRGRDTGALYFDYVTDLIGHVRSHGCQAMLWGDIVLRHPNRLDALPRDVLLLNWDYRAEPDEQGIALLERHGFSQLVCPGTDSWNRFVENPAVAVPNISRMAAFGRAHGAAGLLVTNWGDYGHIAAPGCVLYGLAVGAQKGWNTAAPIDDAFGRAVSRHVYGVADDRLPALVRELAACEESARWDRLVRWASDHLLFGREATLDCCPETVAAADRAELIAAKLAAVEAAGGDATVCEELRLAAEGIALMNRLYPVLAGEQQPEQPADLRRSLTDWAGRYAACWRRGHLESELSLLLDFLRLLETQI